MIIDETLGVIKDDMIHDNTMRTAKDLENLDNPNTLSPRMFSFDETRELLLLQKEKLKKSLSTILVSNKIIRKKLTHPEIEKLLKDLE